MNLKFQEVEWDDKDLMYVEFASKGQKMRWYPKWKDVDDILRCAWLTERAYHSRWGDYFDIVCSEILLKGLLRRLARDPNFTEFTHTDVSVSDLFQTLRNVILREAHPTPNKKVTKN